MILYKDIPCPVLLKKEPDTFLVLFKNEQKWIFKCSLGYGEIVKNRFGVRYFFDGKLHRENGPAIDDYDGDKEWYNNGHLHREDGPSWMSSNGDRHWCKNGHLHRLDGPAVEFANGDKRWFIEGKKFSKKEYLLKIEQMKRDGTYNI